MSILAAGLAQVSINAHDVPRATAFYRDVLGLRHLFDAPPSMSFFQCGGVRLLVGAPEPGKPGPGTSILYFSVPDIEAAHRHLVARGVAIREAPRFVAPLGDRELWLAFFEDSEGNVMALSCEKAATPPSRTA